VASVQSGVSLNLPPNVGVDPTIGTAIDGSPVVDMTKSIEFTYTAAATSVSITIMMDDGTQIATNAAMSWNGIGMYWYYDVSSFYPHYGIATVTYTVDGVQVGPFTVYVDPAGCVFDAVTLKRIAGATVWLEQPDGLGGWQNVSTGQTPPVMQPDVNPETTNAEGQFQWNVLNGTYRVHVEAAGYYPSDSLPVVVPPPVTDLQIALAPIQYYLTTQTDPPDLVTIPGQSWYYQGTNVTLTAPAVANYTFAYWDVDGQSQGAGVNLVSVQMDANHTATAHYYLKATVEIIPPILNLARSDAWVFAYIQLYGGVNVSSIVVSSILMNGTVPVDLKGPVVIANFERTPFLIVTFDGGAVSNLILSQGVRWGSVVLTITGQLKDGRTFQGSDTIYVLFWLPPRPPLRCTEFYEFYEFCGCFQCFECHG